MEHWERERPRREVRIAPIEHDSTAGSLKDSLKVGRHP
jgi:hypothetical protein